MSYILDALRKAEHERGIAQVPTLMTVHETRQATPRHRLWVISGVCLVCAATIVWFTVSFLRTAGAPTPSSSAVATRVQPGALGESSPVEITPVPSSGTVMPLEGRFPSKSQVISTSAPRADVTQTNLPERKRIGDESRSTVPWESQPQPKVSEPAKNAVQQQMSSGAGGAPALPAQNASPAATQGTTTAESSQ